MESSLLLRHVNADERVASRMYIAGVLPNTPENMLRWLQNPLAVQPFTARPDMGVTETDARD